MAHTHTPFNINRDQVSVLLYVESCMVDYGGMLEGRRLNDTDHGNLRMFMADGLLAYGRVPSRLLPDNDGPARPITHWCVLTAAGWDLVAKLRQRRARIQMNSYVIAQEVYAALLDRHDDSWKVADQTNGARP